MSDVCFTTGDVDVALAAIPSTDLRPNLEAIYVPLKLTRQKMTLIPKKKKKFIYLKPFLLYSLSTIVDSRSQCI